MGNLTDIQRRAIVNDLLFSCRDGKPPHGTFAKLAEVYGCHWHSIKRIWDRYQKNVAQGIADGAPESRIKGNSGRKPYDRSKLAAKLKKVPVFQRRRVAATAARIGVSTSLIRSLVDEGYLTRRSRRIKPHLSDNNKIQRMQHTLTFINEQTYQFENMYGMIHIDEKLFNEDIDERIFLVLPDEELPERHRQSKRFIPKTMFLAAVARPR